MTAFDLHLKGCGHPRENVALLYGRLSRGDQSLEAQNRRMKVYAADLHNYFLIGELADDDTTGDTDKLPILQRKAGGQVIAFLKTGKVGHLVVPTVDRIARSARGFLEFYDLLKQHDVTLHIADFGGDSLAMNGFVGKMFLTLMALFAEWELHTIRDRTTKRLRDKRSQGQLTGHVPYGWDVEYHFADGHVHTSATALFWGGKRGKGKTERQNQPADPTAQTLIDAHGLPVDKRLVPNEDERRWLRVMASLSPIGGEGRGEGALSLTAIALQLNAAGVRTKQGRPWQVGTVQSVLTSASTREIIEGLNNGPTEKAI